MFLGKDKWQFILKQGKQGKNPRRLAQKLIPAESTVKIGLSTVIHGSYPQNVDNFQNLVEKSLIIPF